MHHASHLARRHSATFARGRLPLHERQAAAHVCVRARLNTNAHKRTDDDAPSTRLSLSGSHPPHPPRSAGPRDFRVLRSANGNLPIYTDIRNGGTRITTVLRKYAGDAEALAEELKSVTGKTVHLYHGRMEVKGRHRLLMTEWLEKLGF